MLLLVAAAVGKFIGADGGSVFALGRRDAAVLGMSMIPRAGIAVVVMQHGVALGAWAVPGEVFSAMVIASFPTCLLAPIGLSVELRRSAIGQDAEGRP